MIVRMVLTYIIPANYPRLATALSSHCLEFKIRLENVGPYSVGNKTLHLGDQSIRRVNRNVACLKISNVIGRLIDKRDRNDQHNMRRD